MSTTKQISVTVDVELLRRQKQALLRAIVHARDDRRALTDVALLDGVLNLLDYVHDQVDPPKQRAPRRNPLFTDYP